MSLFDDTNSGDQGTPIPTGVGWLAFYIAFLVCAALAVEAVWNVCAIFWR